LLDDPTVSYYDNTDIYGISYPQYSTSTYALSFVTFGQNNLVADMAMLVATEDIGNGSWKTSYYDLDYNLVGEIDNDGSYWSNAIGYTPATQYSTYQKSWWSRWTSCATWAWNGIVNQAPVVGVACIFMGIQCGLSLVVGCAGMATFA
jgi:hypothetical protein